MKPASRIVDPNQLATAIINLALNARDAMPNGGKLILETGRAISTRTMPACMTTSGPAAMP